MPPSLRILRNIVDTAVPRPKLTRRQQERQNRILQGATALMAQFGGQAISFAQMATALRLSSATLRWHYADIDALLADILRRHLRDIAAALDAVPATADPGPALREAYRQATTTPDGTPTPAHLLLTRDRHLLPEDERLPIEQAHHALTRQSAQPGPQAGPLKSPGAAETAQTDRGPVPPPHAPWPEPTAAPQAQAKNGTEPKNPAFLSQPPPTKPSYQAAA